MPAFKRLLHHEAAHVSVETSNVNGTEGCGCSSPGDGKDCKSQYEAEQEPALPRECALPVPPLAAVRNLQSQSRIVLTAARSGRHCELVYKIEAGNMKAGIGGTCTGMAAERLSGQTGAGCSPIYATMRAYSYFI
jgi:hypothetical protein